MNDDERVREIVDEVLRKLDFKQLFVKWATDFLRAEDREFVDLANPPDLVVTIHGTVCSGKSTAARIVRDALNTWGASVRVDDANDMDSFPWRARGKDLDKLLEKALKDKRVEVVTHSLGRKRRGR